MPAIFILFTLLMCLKAHAQFAHSSFSPDTIGFNPATASTRELGIMAVLADYVKEKTTFGLSGSNSDTSEVKVLRSEAMFAKKAKLLSAELYLAYINGTKTRDSVNASASSVYVNNTVNTLGNVAYSATDWLKLGLQYYQSRGEYKEEYKNSQNNTFDSSNKGVNTGIGLGIVVQPLKGLFIGAVKTKIDSAGDSSYSSNWSGTGSSNTSQYKTMYDQYATGISYTRGSTKSSAFRLELGYGTMEFPQSTGSYQIPTGITQTATIEAIVMKLAGGLEIRRTRGIFVNLRTDLKSSMSTDEVPLDEFVLTYGGYVAFKSTKGHSFGVRGSYSDTDSKDIYYYGSKTTGHVNLMTLGLTYAYLF